MRRILIAVLAAGALLVTGCGSGSPSQAQPSGQESPVTDMPSDTPSETPAESTSPGPEEGPAAAMNDLAKRLGIDAEDVAVVSAEEVTWSDASIGCPEPGKMYAQMLVPGSLIVLEADGKQYEYHAAAGKPPFYCEKPQPPVR